MKTTLMLGAVALSSAVALAASSEFLSSFSSADRVITVTGVADRPGWLGISAYPKRGASFSQVRYVAKGNLREKFTLPRQYQDGTYEVALWDRRVNRAVCKTSCNWCKLNGFHMEGMRGYGSGTVGR